MNTRTVEFREKLTRTAGQIPVEIRREEDHAALTRAQSFIERQEERPLAIDYYLTEVAEKDDKVDGRFLTQVLERMEDEIRVLLIRGNTRELALTLSSIQEARHWAEEYGRRTNSHVLIDRRIFKIVHAEEAQ